MGHEMIGAVASPSTDGEIDHRTLRSAAAGDPIASRALVETYPTGREQFAMLSEEPAPR